LSIGVTTFHKLLEICVLQILLMWKQE